MAIRIAVGDPWPAWVGAMKVAKAQGWVGWSFNHKSVALFQISLGNAFSYLKRNEISCLVAIRVHGLASAITVPRGKNQL